MRPVALVGCRSQTAPPADERPLLRALAERGAPVDWIVWERTAPAPGSVVVPRATWTYHRSVTRYRAWLAHAEAEGCGFVNPLAAIRWNLDKAYLLELASAGVDVIPTRRFDAGAAPPLHEVLRWAAAAGGFEDGRSDGGAGRGPGTGNARVVLKPAVSASGDDTWVASQPPGLEAAVAGVDAAAAVKGDEAAAEARWADATAARPHLAQPFLREVLDEGEWSVVVIAGAITHVVLKRPLDGEFRVQGERGGSKERIPESDVPRSVALGAIEAWGALPGRPAYARMDGVRVGDRFLLMEAELIDPELYLTMSGGAAADALADAIVAAAEGSASAARASAS